MAQMNQDFNQEYENIIINQEYKIWKKNAPFLYDMVITNQLQWPSYTVQWLPTKDVPNDSDYAIHKLLLGTNVTGTEPNYLMIAQMRLPKEDTPVDITEYQQNNQQVGGIGLASGQNKLDIQTQIVHEGELNRVRYMPQKYNIIASKTVTGDILIFDYKQHPTRPENQNVCQPQLRLTGHDKEGYGLSWNPQVPGLIVSGSYDKRICTWNIQGGTELISTISPLSVYEVHQAPVEDVAWHQFHPDIFGSVSDDRTLLLWDIRLKQSTPTHSIKAHTGDIYSLDFNPFNDFLLLTGSQDKSIGFWDIRNLSKRIHTFEGHTDHVLQVEWSPFNVGVFASSSADRKMIVWDLSQCGEQKGAEDPDGPPEQIFVHAGHRSRVVDFNWNIQDNLVIASTEESAIVQVWQMAQHIYDDEQLETNQESHSNVEIEK